MKNKSLYIFAFLLIFLISLEIGLRFIKPLKTYSELNFNNYQSAYEAPEQSLFTWQKNDSILSVQEEFKFLYVTDSFGFINQHSLKNCHKDSSILFFGDSFTFGVGAPQDSSAVVLLENKIPFKIINAGIPGSDPFFQKQLYDSLFQEYGFKKALFMVNFSDIYDYVIRGGDERFLTTGKITYRKAPWFEPIYQYSFVFRAIIHKVFHYDFSLLPPQKMKTLKKDAVLAYAKLFMDLSKKIDVIVIIQPYSKQYTSQSKELAEVLNYQYLEDLEILLKENEIKTLNLNTHLKEYINEETYLNYSWKLDGHYNANGYKLLSELIYKDLKEAYPEFIEN
jgi:lysophospholipase L1-like esterase